MKLPTSAWALAALFVVSAAATGCEVRVNGDTGATPPAGGEKPNPAPTGDGASGPGQDLPIAQAPTGDSGGDSGGASGGAEGSDSGSDAPGEPTIVEPAVVGTDFAPVATDAERLACSSDADCVLTPLRDGGCCGQLCRTNRALNKDVLAKLEAAIETSCADVPCPVAKCTKPEATYEAKCVEQSCVVYATPIAN